MTVLLDIGILLGAVVVSARWLHRRWLAHEIAKADALIAANRPKEKRFEKADDALRQRTELRRNAADRLHRRAAAVESGAGVAQILAVRRTGSEG